LIFLLRELPACGSVKAGKGAKAKGSGKTRELETQPCQRII